MFKKQCFSDLFCKNIDDFFEYTRLLSHAQYEAINSRLNQKSILDKFKYDIDKIADISQGNLFKYICSSIKNIVDLYSVNKFESINFLSKETHNNKKSALSLIADGRNFIYKPYNADYLVLLSNIFNVLKHDLKYDLNIFPEVLINTDKFHITNFIEYENPIDSQTIYYSIGAVLAFSFIMRIVDLDSDNVIFKKNNLYIVDCETCFYRNIHDSNFYLDLTLLIGNNKYCALFDKMKNEFCMQLNEQNEVVYLKPRNKNHPNLNIQNNIELLKNGFHDCYKAVISNKNKIVNMILFSPLMTRHILRPTNSYTIWMIELFKPTINFETNKKNLQLNLLKYLKGDINKNNIDVITKHELSDMIKTDIPFFNVLDKDLFHNQELIYNNFYKESFSNFIRKWIGSLKINDITYLNKNIEHMIKKQV